MRITKLAGIIAATGVVVAAAGCAESSTPAEQSDKDSGCATSSTSGDKDAALLPVPPAKVTVSNPGAGAQPISAELARTPQKVTMSATTTSKDGSGERSQAIDIPITARINCTDASDLEMLIGAVRSTTADLAPVISSVDDTVAGASLAPGLAPISLRIRTKTDVQAQAQAALEQGLLQTLQRSVVVPTAPIGVGAQWTAERTVIAGATLQQTTTATLVARTGNRLTIDYSIDESPTDSVYRLPNGESLTIDSYSMAGKGRVVLDTSRGLPVEGSVELTGGRNLVGSDRSKPLIQETGFSAQWKS